MNSRKCKCEICNVDVHRASYVKDVRSKKHSESEKQNKMIIPGWLFEEPIENKIQKLYNPKPSKQIARDNIKLAYKQLNKQPAKKRINPYFFTDRLLRVGVNITLESHHVNHANSNLNIEPNYPEFGIEVRYFDKVIRKYIYCLC